MLILIISNYNLKVSLHHLRKIPRGSHYEHEGMVRTAWFKIGGIRPTASNIPQDKGYNKSLDKLWKTLIVSILVIT
ncbi:hypothetical protein RIR_jg32162.t1 [Rhizophagus irregularis DAOM 181602=DAOM 197198]|uniref:Uncharacterized protein n=1 Tax=Rhizophagus irregularis (strain DAOM 181602 / DAOM 197198 / MUCL 43194) TaxID=747089 RepID=U9TGU8_RHIID|nr:hypothetical protein RIR_jg32162.t1 [Rhizophagus irregularis DAOM 181602=DAOM 197198]